MVGFFTSDSEVWCKTEDGMERLDEKSPFVGVINERVEQLYPQADMALRECYSKAFMNTPYYNYLRARRFCKCNFGALDHTVADESEGFHFERISCPLRGECKHEGIICLPKMETRLSEAENRVMRLVCEGKSNMEIADELYLSPNTVKRHISTSYIKVGVRNRADFVRYASSHDILLKKPKEC